MFTAEQIKVANATSRSNGASARNKDGSIRAIVPKWVAENVQKDRTILDFGSGKGATHTIWLREQGFNVTAYDFGNNLIEGLHDKDALSKQYRVIFASNVLNVQRSVPMLMETLWQIYNSLERGGIFVCNYPSSPRKIEIPASQVASCLKYVFGGSMERIGGTSSAPMWVISKLRVH